VLTDPGQHAVPVSPAELAAEARRAYDAGASVQAAHFDQAAGPRPPAELGPGRGPGLHRGHARPARA
jgi:hypothetical protein